MPSLPYHWTPALEDRFIALLAETGSVRVAAHGVCMSPKSAYNRRQRQADFARRWAVALRWAQERLLDQMLEVALEGQDEHQVRNPHTGRRHWRRSDPALGRGRGMGLLSRIDRMLACQHRRSGLREPTN